MISQKTIQEVVETAKVEDVVGDYVNLKRSGSSMKGLCPFHNEKTPSFMVSPGKNIYKCFGCGKGGDPIRFMMDHDAMSYPEAIRHLAGRYNIEIEELQTSQASKEEKRKLDDLHALNQYAHDHFIHQMWQTDYGKSIGLGYFKDRGFREETIKKWGLGFAPDKKNDFILRSTNDGYQLEQLQKIGLASKSGYDFYRGRVMFPIRNISGKVIGFGGRVLAKNAKTAKYLNSIDSEVYNKSRVLYGIHFARQPIRKVDECLMVEGYTDTIALHQAGIENVVAPCGTSLTPDQIRLVKRYTPNLTFLFDGDAAGKKAALRGLDMVLEQDMNVKVVLLPEGEDPDSLLQQLGSTKFEEFITRNKKDFILFKTDLLLEEAGNDPIKKAELIKDIVASIAKIPDAIKRSVFTKECASLTQTNEQLLVNELNKVIGKNISKSRKSTYNNDVPFPTENEYNEAPPEERIEQPDTKPKQGDEFQEKDIVRILIEAGSFIMDEETGLTTSEFILENIADLLDYFDSKDYVQIVQECMAEAEKGNALTPSYFINHKDSKIRDLTMGILTSPYEYSFNWDKKLEMPLQSQKKPEENFTRDTIESVNRFKLHKVMKIMKENQDKLKSIEKDNVAQMMKILKVQQKLMEMKKELAAYFGSVVLK